MAGRDEVEATSGSWSAAAPKSERGVRAADREAAFGYWGGLPYDQRRYAVVAKRFGVSPRTVERWARDGRWRERLRAIEADAACKADDEFGSRRAKQLREFWSLLDASFGSYERQLASGDVRITASDFIGLVKVGLLLNGTPADRVEDLAGGEEWAALRSRILEAIAPFPEARLALAEALEEVDDEQADS
jgi:transcriptional regulator with XRE-family HTH domain